MKREPSICGVCGGEIEENRRHSKQRKCRQCHVDYVREWRRERGGYAALTDEQRRRANCRAYTRAMIRKGKLIRQPCESCGASPERSEAHHLDYDKPMEVRWFCRDCHMDEHDVPAREAA